MQSGNEIRPVPNSAVNIVNAAAAALATAESRHRLPLPELPRRKWADRLSMYFCFRSPKNSQRIIHSAPVQEPVPQWAYASAPEIPNHAPPPVSPFVAPPSSPDFIVQSESLVQSPPIGTPPFSSLSQNSPSPTAPPSIFDIGPYANETELVSPPVFSAFSTESSSANFTPPESVHVTTPSSPDVPYAKLLTSINNSNDGETGDLQAYLTSPSSSSSHNTAAIKVGNFSGRLQHKDHAMDHRKLTVEEVARCLDKKPASSRNYATSSFQFAPIYSGDHKRESLSLPKGFNFNNVDATNVEQGLGSDLWANEKVAEVTAEPEKE